MLYIVYTATLPLVEVDGRELRRLRGRKVLSMRELEKLAGISYNTVWRLETGKTGAQPRTIRKLAEALGVDPAQLVKEETEG